MFRILRSLFEDPTFDISRKFSLFDENEGQTEGAGDSAAGDASGQRTEAEHEQQQQQESQSDQRRQPERFRRDQQWIPKTRFDEVNNKYAAYRSFGQPQEVQAKLARLAELEKQPQNRYNEAQQEEIRQDLLRVFPELRSVVDSHKNQAVTFVAHGARQNEKFMKDLGVEVNENNNLHLQELLGGVIQRDPQLTQRFYARDPTVFEDAFKVARSAFWPNQRRTVPGLQTVARKTPAPAGGKAKAASEAPGEPKAGHLFEREVLDKASEEAFSRISEQME